jgi:hypothetical protein
MSFSKSFPKTEEGISYPKWIEIYLSLDEEEKIEFETKTKNKKLMIECINDAKDILSQTSLKDFQTNLISVAISLFEKRASHVVYEKERLCKDKFDSGEFDPKLK